MKSGQPKPSALTDEAPATVPQTTPTGIGYGHPEYQFVQSIMEMQKSLGEINASILGLGKSIDSTKAKVDDLVNWKNRILGGAIVLGVVISVLVFAVTKAWDYISIKSPAITQTVNQAPAQQQTLPIPNPAPVTPKANP